MSLNENKADDDQDRCINAAVRKVDFNREDLVRHARNLQYGLDS